MKRGESLGKLVSLMVRNDNGQISTREGGVSQLLFVGMLAVLVRQASAEDILPQLALDSTQGSSKQRFTEEETEWSLKGGYGYFVRVTVAPTLHILSQAMAGA